MRSQRNVISRSLAVTLVIFLLSVIGAFAFGSADAAGCRVRPRKPAVNSNIFRQPRSLAAENAVAGSEKLSKSRIRIFFSKLNPSSGRRDGRWKAGESKANLPARLLFSYVGPLLDLASQRTLTEKDSFEVSENRKVQNSVDTLADIYDKSRRKSQKRIEEQRQKGSNAMKKSQSFLLLVSLIKHQRKELLTTGIQRLINTAVQAFPPILVARLLRFIEAADSVPLSTSLSSALLLFSVLNLKMITENQFFNNVVNMSTITRGSLEGLIFDKSLRLPGGGSNVLTAHNIGEKEKALGSGGVLNLMQSDASIIESAAMQIHTIWDGPLQIAMYTSLLFKYLGPSVFWGVAVLLSVIPVNGICLRILDRLARGENEARDARTKRTAESITNMKLLKVQAWENQFAEEIRKHRKDELDRHKLRGIVRGINAAISNAVPALVLVVTLTAYARTGRPIVASTIFTAISLFNQLRFPLFFYPMLIDSLANGKNSLRRISSYLNSEELTPYVETLPHTGSGSIEMKNGNFLWSTSQAPKQGEVAPPESPALCNVNLKVNPGEIVAVVGPVGSGKSALIEGLLGELAPVPRMVVSDPFTDVSNTDDLIDKPSVTLHGNVAYCSQEAWLPKGTLRDAVVFGREYDESRYLAAIRDAGLDNDIVSNSGVTSKLDASGGLLSHNTDVGEGGSSLSGGQRARVALARALYGGEDTKVFLLDDCLAALDARVGSLVFERLIRRLKASNAATVFVTNDPSLPRRCDRVVLMGPSDRAKSSSSSCSTIVDMGTYDELLDRGHNIQSFSSSNDSEEDRTLPLRPEKEKGEISQSHDIKIERMVAEADTIRIPGGYKVMANDTDLSCHADPECQEIDLQNSPDYISERVVPIDPEDEARVNADRPALNSTGPIGQGRQTKLISADETMSTEAVPFSTYTSYLKAIRSPTLIFGMLAAFATVSGAQFFQQYTVMKWTELARDDAMAAALGSKYLRSLFGAACVVSVSLWFRSFFTMMVGVRASDFLHDRMVSSVFRAPMSFFDATPSGQLLSRFGKEIGIIDRTLPDNYASVLWCALQVVSSAMAIAGAITPAMALPLFFAGSLYVKTMKKFRPAARDMKRSETMTRSPIFTHFGEALRGAEIIRSTPGATKTWSTTHRTLSDINLSVYATVKALDRWLSCSLENLGNSLVLTAAVACVFLSRAGRLKAGAAGWGLTQSLSITGLMAWAIRNLTSLETHMMSVMRVKELTDLDSEEAKVELHPGAETEKFTMPRELIEPGEALKAQFPKDVCLNTTVTPLTEAALKADGWPWKGGVRFKNVSMRYNPLSPLVLKDLSVSVPPGSTLGVVGRTGSGKSSMLLTLFRIVEIEGVGRIELDGVDIRSVSIQTLRERLSIIPQDPVLFAGTIAYNLDATGKASPESMWDALEAASPELAKQFRATGGLGTTINEGGGNFSQGQRQLICLARALLRRSKILVLDEATSSVDANTDKQVQDTIRKQFVDKGVTVITVAHRLDTVLGYDNILVLGDGSLKEYGTPSELLKIPNGELRQLVDADRRNKRKGAKKEVNQALAI